MYFSARSAAPREPVGIAHVSIPLFLFQREDEHGVDGVSSKAFPIDGEPARQAFVHFEPHHDLFGGSRAAERALGYGGLNQITVRPGFAQLLVVLLRVPRENSLVVRWSSGSWKLPKDSAATRTRTALGKRTVSVMG